MNELQMAAQDVYTSFVATITHYLAVPLRAANLAASVSEIYLALCVVIAWVAIAARACGKNGLIWAIIGAVSYSIPAFATDFLSLNLLAHGLDFDRLPQVSRFFIVITPIESAAIGAAVCWLVKRKALRVPEQNSEPESDSFWRGPIRNTTRANVIVMWAGLVFVGFAFVLLCSPASALLPHDQLSYIIDQKTDQIATVTATYSDAQVSSDSIIDVLFWLCLFVLPAIALITRKSSAAAVVLIAGSILLLGAMLFIIIDLLIKGLLTLAPIHFIFLLALTLLSWRAFKATTALTKVRIQDASTHSLAAES